MMTTSGALVVDRWLFFLVRPIYAQILVGEGRLVEWTIRLVETQASHYDSKFDQPKVPVLAFVHHPECLGLRIAKDDKLKRI